MRILRCSAVQSYLWMDEEKFTVIVHPYSRPASDGHGHHPQFVMRPESQCFWGVCRLAGFAENQWQLNSPFLLPLFSFTAESSHVSINWSSLVGGRWWQKYQGYCRPRRFMSIHRQTVASPNVVGLKMCWRTRTSINIEIKVSASYSDVSIVNHHRQSAMQSQLPCLKIIVDVTLLTRWQNIKSTSAHWCKIWKSNQYAGDKYIDPPLSATDGDVRFVPKYEIYANLPKILKILRRPLQKPRVYHCSVGGGGWRQCSTAVLICASPRTLFVAE